MEDILQIRGARVHNLKNVSIDLPKGKLIVITGLSGSGKSSLAFDTIYAEGQRRYAESLNAYARQFMGVMDKPDVDEIKGISPTIAIDQKNSTQNPRSTVGTATEIYDYLRLLFARLGKQFDPETDEPATSFSPGEIIEALRKLAEKEPITILSPLKATEQKTLTEISEKLELSHITEVIVDDQIITVSELKKINQNFPNKKLQAVIRKGVKGKKVDADILVEKALAVGEGAIIFKKEKSGELILKTTYPFTLHSGKVFDPIEPRTFSFNSPYGACPRCTGLGYTLEVDENLVIPNPRLSLAEGAIQPWTRIVGNQNFYQKLIEVVANKKNFSTKTPFKDLSEAIKKSILYGTGKDTYEIDGKVVKFEGVVINLRQRHAETDSDYIKKEIEVYMRETICSSCHGRRLKPEALFVKIGGLSITDLTHPSLSKTGKIIGNELKKKSPFSLTANEMKIAEPIFKEITRRLEDLSKVGLNYLSLDRSLGTLSGGETQRVRLATQLSTGLTNVIYILDEPSIGLHSRDNEKLIETLKNLRDLGNTVIVVEHDAAMIEAADFVVDIGPGAGREGGEILAYGTPKDLEKNERSVTARYLNLKNKLTIPKKRRSGNGKKITIREASGFNLKKINVEIPLGKLVSITGVSGSGKSTLIIDILARALAKHFYRAKEEPAAHKDILGLENIDKVITIDQSPIGRTPRSNPATYTGVFTPIRDLYTNVSEAKRRGFDAGMFSFNVKGGGRCEACTGEGFVRIPMQFLSDVFVECAECGGKRYTRTALDVKYRDKNIADVLDMTVEEAYIFFRDVTGIAEKLNLLREVGLGYLRLGQGATTLSGGEAQRIKLATELSRRATGRTLYILDEPTTGLHFADIERLMAVLNQLVEKGNTILMIEHNLDVVAASDWVIDLGPSGGEEGGELIFAGIPENLSKIKKSETGKFLKYHLD